MTKDGFVPRPTKNVRRNKHREWYGKLEATLTNGKAIEIPFEIAIKLQQSIRLTRRNWRVRYRQSDNDGTVIAWAEATKAKPKRQ